MTARDLWESVRKYFNLKPDKEDESAIVEQISSGVSFRGANLWVLIFAIFIASLGLNVNSTAVIIGAMLIEVNRDSTDTRHYVAAIIDDDGRRSLSREDTEKLHDWLQARIKADSLVVIKRE